MNAKKIAVLALAAAAAAGTAAVTTSASAATPREPSARPRAEVASVVGSAEIRRTYQRDDDVRAFTIDAHAAPYTRPLPRPDGGPGLPGAPNDATGTVTVAHTSVVQGRKVTFTARAAVDSLVTAPGYASLTAVVTWTSPGGPPWVGKRLGFSVYDAGKDAPGRSHDRLGYSWEFVNLAKGADGSWSDETPVGTAMAPAPFAPVTRGGFTVTHADLPPVPGN
ncbi:hypothetical protein [Actinomadura harenae]|uniref:Uncharacterized protein n=1 Tax=Actinomadura harenae TaxID=2483351 RepID=A0A3M2LRW9_9ACTN|nr:hypothetical protein [Actinomadura harenae]RMI39640.1 hypothetical protein EBO15_29180 [Actinomadura harenae]